MPTMTTTVTVPSDGLYQFGGLIITAPDKCRDLYSTSTGRVIVAPTSYTIKRSNLLSLSITATHPAWYYSGMDYDTDTSQFYVSYQQALSDPGVEGIAEITNPKKAVQMSTMAGAILPSTVDFSAMDDVPLSYFGHSIATKEPTDTTIPNTILTQVIDTNYLNITCLSAVEYEIEVLDTLLEDQWFYLPESNPKGLSSTIWGKLGTESTLPPGACAGLVKIHGQSILDSAIGAYAPNLTAEELAVLQKPTGPVHDHGIALGITPESVESEPNLGNGVDRIDDFKGVVEPTWWVNPLAGVSMYQTISNMQATNKVWFACGYDVGACTVGTGVFVKNQNVPCSLSYTAAGVGLQYKSSHPQSNSSFVEQVSMGQFMDCEGFLETVAKAGLTADPLEVGAIIPVCAADLQFSAHTAGPTGSYHVPYDSAFRYPYPAFNNDLSVEVTPLYLPANQGLHCYTPKLWIGAATRCCLLTPTNLTDPVNLAFKMDSKWSNIYRTTHELATSGSFYSAPNWVTVLPARSRDTFNTTADAQTTSITDNPILEYTQASDPTGGCFKDLFGFTVETWEHTYSMNIARRYGMRGGMIYQSFAGFRDLRSKIGWVNSSAEPVVGLNATSIQKTIHAGVSGMVMAFTGFLPAGTPAGTYKFKPFASTETLTGYLSCNPSPEYVATNVSATLKPKATQAPYIGLNYVYAEGSNILWNFDQPTDLLNDYTFYRVLLKVQVDMVNKTHTMENVVIAVDSENAPLIGYPVTDKPVLIQIDDVSGKRLNEIEDLCVTNPFYSEELKSWIVVGASILHGKMYRIAVEMDPTLNYVVEFKTVVDSADLLDTPYGRFTKLLGLCQTRDVYSMDARLETVRKSATADIVFLVDDSGSMPTYLQSFKDNIEAALDVIYSDPGINDVRVGMACYDTQQKSAYYNDGTLSHKWAVNVAEAVDMANQLSINFTNHAGSKNAHHWTAINWALQNYDFRDVKAKYIFLLTDALNEGDTLAYKDLKETLFEQNIHLYIIAQDESYFEPAFKGTDGTYLSLVQDTSMTQWGELLASRLAPRVVSEIKNVYTIQTTDDHLVLYGITETAESASVKGTNLVVATCRTYLEWDTNRDTIVRLRVQGPDTTPVSDFLVSDTYKWPHGIAVLFPYLYVLGYTYTKSPSAVDQYEGSTSTVWTTGQGWQMCMWRIDMTAGLVDEPILIKDSASLKFSFGVPAISSDTKQILQYEWNNLGKLSAIYTCTGIAPGTITTPPGLIGTPVTIAGKEIPIAASANVPRTDSPRTNYELPSISGLCAVAGQLLAFSNYQERPVVINPLSGLIETTGLSIYPFTYPFDANVAVKGEFLSTLGTFGGYKVYTTHPYYQLCIGDGSAPNAYSMGIDVHDITSGEVLVRKCYVRNNSLRDRLTKVQLIVPNDTVLPGSEMVWLSLTGNDADKVKLLNIPEDIHPCEKVAFYLHVVPTITYNDENLRLYLNAKFSRVTEYFGYLND